MAEGDAVLYNSFKHYVLEGVFNLASGGHTLKMMLVNGYTPNIDTHAVKADVVGTEYTTGGGYTAGGATLAGQDATLDTANDRGKFDATDLTWATLTLDPATPSHAILYDDTVSSPVADPLIMYFVLGATATNGTDYTLIFGANGLILLT
jgi:hypothetical protein